MKRKCREAMRAADALRHYEEAASRRTLFEPMQPAPLGEVWRPTMTEQQQQELEQRIKEHNLPF